MLEAEEVDDDYFTPVASTSLSNIFGNPQTEETQNESLKYSPPKPQDVAPRPEESKATQCLFASALNVYEWVNNTYTARGKLGFAILKFLKHGICNIVIYNSNKTTLSSVLISPKLEITVNGSSFISYYDNLKKYWCVYATDEEIKKIYELLETLSANVKFSLHKDKGPPEPKTLPVFLVSNTTSSTIKDEEKGDKESDTDSSVNRRTKISILNRMASMGHSVLPTHMKVTDNSSDSSNTNDSSQYTKTIRHKTPKNIVKRDRKTSDKDVTETQTFDDSHETIVYHNGQLVPVNHSHILTNPSSSNIPEMNIFLSEQRTSNSELRINMNRMTDKVDMVLNKMSDLETRYKSDSTSDFQTQILQKLLREYENKIKFYEDILKTNGITDINFVSNCSSQVDNKTSEIGCLQIKITELEQINKDKSNEISKLHNDIMLLNKKLCDAIQNKNDTNELTNKIVVLEESLNIKNDALVKITKEFESVESNIENKVKNIMNDTFRALSSNFENNDAYAGDAIKTVIAAVIKKVTIDSLSRL